MNDEHKEIRGQRHDFIKEYYKMATLDLDRHLKAGWQTIAVIAGGAAILTAGHDGKIGLPIATMIALFSAFWGAATVIDANFWSLRAIAFMSNVEAVYFSTEDRKRFNPYIGDHPKYKLINSLHYMFLLCILFGIASVVNLIWEVTTAYPSPILIYDRIVDMNWMRQVFWLLPFFTILLGLLFTLRAWRKGLERYIRFSRGSPGPGVISSTGGMRHVTLEPIKGGPILTYEPDNHSKSLEALNKIKGKLDRCTNIATVIVVTASIGLFCTIFL
ncbi:hypothetical protein [Phyllobacterium sp. P5_D12]